MIEDVRAALLGDHEAAKRLTDAGVLVPCGHCGKQASYRLTLSASRTAWGENGRTQLYVGHAVQHRDYVFQRRWPASPGTPARRF